MLRDADELLAHSYRVGYVRGVATALAGRAFVLAHRGRPEDAARCVAEAREVYGAAAAADRHIFTVVEIADAAAALAAGDPGRARALAAAAVATPTTLPCLGLALLGEAQVAAGDPAGRPRHRPPSRRARAGRTLAGRVRAAGSRGWPGRRSVSGRRRWPACDGAADRLDGLGLPFQTARAWLGWAEVAAAGRAGDDQVPAAGADAVEAARRSLAAFDRLGARPLADRARRLLRAWASGRPLRPGRRPASCRSGSCRWSGWSPSGSATPRSPERLFISPRTVTTHLQHVYGRLGLAVAHGADPLGTGARARATRDT